MSDVSVIGLGNMGSAIARALLSDGHRVTVWNRTKTRAEPLVSDGATLAPDPAAAVIASPIIVICLRDHEVANSLLFSPEVRPHLAGRLLVQLGGGTPQQSRASERLAHDSNAEYLDGEIMVYPDQIGTPDARILLAGPEAAFRRCEALLHSVAGRLIYAGRQIGAANAYGLAMGAVLYGALLSALHGARVCEAEGLDIDQLATGLAAGDMDTIAAAVQDMLARIPAGRYGDSLGTLQTGADGAEQMLDHAREMGLDDAFAVYVDSALRRGIDAGLGDQDVAALIEVLRKSE